MSTFSNPDDYIPPERFEGMPEFPFAGTKSSAEIAYVGFLKEVREFKESLDQEQKIVLKFFLPGETLSLQNVASRPRNPSFIVFEGYKIESKTLIRLVLPVSQLHISFIAVGAEEAQNETPARQAMGFVRH